MSHLREPTIRVRVDPTNPGQFFACCGLLELADRRGRGAEGWFEEGAFCIRSSEPGESLEQTLGELLSAVAGTSLLQLDADDNCSSPIEISSPFNLRLDWWKDNRAGGDRLKLWAGRMSAIRIARAMQNALMQPECNRRFKATRYSITRESYTTHSSRTRQSSRSTSTPAEARTH